MRIICALMRKSKEEFNPRTNNRLPADTSRKKGCPFLLQILSQDVRIELAFEIGELVFQQQLALFQPLQAQLVG